MGRGQWSLTGLRTSLRAGPTGARHGTAADDVDAPRTRWRVSSPAARQHEQSPPNAGVNDFEFAICEGPSALPSLDPMILQQWQTQQLLRMSQRTVHMHSMIEMLQEQNRTLNAEKSNTLRYRIRTWTCASSSRKRKCGQKRGRRGLRDLLGGPLCNACDLQRAVPAVASSVPVHRG